MLGVTLDRLPIWGGGDWLIDLVAHIFDFGVSFCHFVVNQTLVADDSETFSFVCLLAFILFSMHRIRF